MSDFITNIKTPYTGKTVIKDKFEFSTPYSSKTTRKIVSGENRSVGKVYTSKMIVK